MKPLYVEWVHGLDAKPWGTKSTALRDEAASNSVAMEALDYNGVNDPEQRAALLVKRIRDIGSEASVALAGSSMGGYVSLLACREVKVEALWLLCPALSFEQCRFQEFPWAQMPMTVVHGWDDEAVPVDCSIRLARAHQAILHLIPGDHRFSGSLDIIRELFATFLRQLKEVDAPS